MVPPGEETTSTFPAVIDRAMASEFADGTQLRTPHIIEARKIKDFIRFRDPVLAHLSTS
jgi:hypothetical protein